MGIPTFNTVLITSSNKNAFNITPPNLDRTLWRENVIEHILALNNNNQAHAEQTADLLLPDMLVFNVNSQNGFDSLNGRRPQDDVIDKELNVLTNNNASGNDFISDSVPSNDVQFLTTFPFFAPPHAAAEGVPVRN
jgi:hypothetical protein